VRVLEQLRVRGLHVIGLVEGVDAGLPVARDLERDVVQERVLLEVIRIEVLRDDAEIVAQRLRAGGEAHPDEPAPGVARHGCEPTLCIAESLREVLTIGSEAEGPVDAERPAVETADEVLGPTRSGRNEPVPAMWADVVEGAEAPGAITRDHDRL